MNNIDIILNESELSESTIQLEKDLEKILNGGNKRTYKKTSKKKPSKRKVSKKSSKRKDSKKSSKRKASKKRSGKASKKASKRKASKKSSKRKSSKKASKKRPLNEYMLKLKEARKKNLDSFEYKGKTYVKAKTKTGMVIYKAK